MLSETLIVAALVSVAAIAAPTAKPPLQFTANGTFHISVFNDIHFGESELRHNAFPLRALRRIRSKH